MGIVGQQGPAVEPEIAIDPAVQAQVMANRQRRGAPLDEGLAGGEAEEREDRSTPEVIRAAARGEKLTESEVVHGIDHFLADGDTAARKVEPTELKLNLGTKQEPKLLRWVVMPVEDTVITRIRKESTKGTRQQIRNGQGSVDEAVVGRKIVVHATVEPDLGALAKQLGVLDPADGLYAFFRKYGKTGLITQLSGEILSISGWDDEDISEVEAARG